MAQQKPIAPQQVQTREQIAQKRIHQQNAQRREHQRRVRAREAFVESLAAFIECAPADVPRYAKNHGIPLYQGWLLSKHTESATIGCGFFFFRIGFDRLPIVRIDSMLTNAKTMLRTVSENGRATFSCVPRPARTVGATPDERLKLIRERVGAIVQIYCDFIDGDVYLPNPAKHTDSIDVIEVSSPEEAWWTYATRESSVSFYDRKPTTTDSGHRDAVILLSEKPLKRDVGIFLAPADCAIIGLSHRDPEIDFAALIHSGWKGTAKDIVGQTIDRVKAIFGNSVTDDLEASISPFAKSCCYEFGLDTFTQAFMRGRVPEAGEPDTVVKPLWHKLWTPPNFGLHGKNGKTYLDAGVLIHQTLEKSGIPDERTKDLSLCTVCTGHEKGYSSSRKDPNARFGVFMGLKAKK